MTRALFLTRALQAATFTGIRTPKVKALGVVELWFLYQARRGDVVQLAVPVLGRGWAIPRAELVAGMFAPTTTDTGVLIASGPRRTRLLLPSHDGTPGRVALYTPRGPLLAALCDTATAHPDGSRSTPRAGRCWPRCATPPPFARSNGRPTSSR